MYLDIIVQPAKPRYPTELKFQVVLNIATECEWVQLWEITSNKGLR